ncbi:DUF2255 family protein [Fructilactobacillus sp. Tb1]|uniref:DUF2255 family protein n=1 Tax=Fructilactobacillus sp. Tb1 TaxID=3422304 RepID=UPI003D272EE8
MKWSKEQLKNFAKANDMKISPFYSDGKTYGTPTYIWSVVADNNLYVRAYNGQNSSWYKAAVQQGAGKIHLAGNDYEVIFEKVNNNPEIDKDINDAYENKYNGSPYLAPMLESGPTNATIKILPK